MALDVVDTSLHINRRHERNKKKKLRKKLSKKRRLESKNSTPPVVENQDGYTRTYSSDSDEDELPSFELKGPFERFKLNLEDDAQTSNPVRQPDVNLKARTAAVLAEAAAEQEDDFIASKNKNKDFNTDSQIKDEATGEILSKKKLKRLNRPSVSSLKQMVQRPDVVEMWDVCARDPLLLTYLKAYRNTVPVPKHWCAKRKYLQGKRGFEKPPFRLPEFIVRTGIMEMRQTVQDKDGDKTLKTKMREKIRPKVGHSDIDYHRLHDAFFKHQTKPKLSIHGDLYYEGKEFEVKLKEKKPGDMSEELRSALGLPSGAGSERYPPPWLIAMQRYGPPPSYPNLKVPGLNAPLPDGCTFGYHPGGWGKPPVDELGRPVYGDVFGNGGNVAGVPPPPPSSLEEVDQQIAQGTVSLWGELEEESDEEEAEEESDDEDQDEDAMDTDESTPGTLQLITPGRPEPASGFATPATTGLITPSGVSSVGAGLDTPQSSIIELRKKTIEEAMEDSSGLVTPSSQLYRVLPETDVSMQPGLLMGSSKLYDTAGVTGAPRGMEADDPRMVASRRSGIDSSTYLGAMATTPSGLPPPPPPPPPPATKKYKEFKF